MSQNEVTPTVQAILHVLYVEDDPALRMSTADLLEDIGHKVVEAADPQEALDRLGSGEPVDILVTDLRMPLMDGRELVQKARALRPGLKVIYVTGASDDSIRDIARDTATACLIKPFSHTALNELLQKMS